MSYILFIHTYFIYIYIYKIFFKKSSNLCERSNGYQNNNNHNNNTNAMLVVQKINLLCGYQNNNNNINFLDPFISFLMPILYVFLVKN